MNTHDELPGSLRGALQRRADGVGDDHPFTLDDVKGRAHGIRRRRIAVSGLAAAAVLAIAVPVGLNATGSPGASPSFDPANRSPSPSQTAEPSPDRASEGVDTPVSPIGQVLTTDRPAAAEQTLTTVSPGRINPPGGASPVAVEADYQSVVPLGSGWVAIRSDGSDLVADRVDATGAVDATYAAGDGGLSVSRDGAVVAWSDPDNRVVTLVDGGEPQEIYRAEGTVFVAAIDATGSCTPGADDGCVVHLNRQDRVESLTVTSQGDVAVTPGLAWVNSVAADGRVAGMIKVEDYGSCSGVVAAGSQRPLWRTCDYAGLVFSPSGRWVMGVDPQGDGAGSSSIAILDAATGEVVTSLVNNRRTQAFVAQREWNESDQVVMSVAQAGTWRTMQLSVTGEFSAVRGGDYESSDPYVSDVHLETTP
ncbi:hypothetical protein G7072_02965 [Nocardioides sp. HDW12B]|uniref:hypothetical protein n=1 Tax=Nocardioides sp. HDW12B TaxID=2714939 RepID=UPI00140A8196|nr:hypothetical protein [Nocardioides sp. HDW12B]QIK65438.1 hypothetical protein G7072_02965 [Nocardioides sp. HDW12B]